MPIKKLRIAKHKAAETTIPISWIGRANKILLMARKRGSANT